MNMTFYKNVPLDNDPEADCYEFECEKGYKAFEIKTVIQKNNTLKNVHNDYVIAKNDEDKNNPPVYVKFPKQLDGTLFRIDPTEIHDGNSCKTELYKELYITKATLNKCNYILSLTTQQAHDEYGLTINNPVQIISQQIDNTKTLSISICAADSECQNPFLHAEIITNKTKRRIAGKYMPKWPETFELNSFWYNKKIYTIKRFVYDTKEEPDENRNKTMYAMNPEQIEQHLKQSAKHPSELKHLFQMICTNAFMAEYDGKPVCYDHPDLRMLAEYALENDEKVFYANPKSQDNPAGPYIKADPNYVWKLTRELSDDEFKMLMTALEEADKNYIKNKSDGA